mgnify:CR=1 FL=1
MNLKGNFIKKKNKRKKNKKFNLKFLKIKRIKTLYKFYKKKFMKEILKIKSDILKYSFYYFFDRDFVYLPGKGISPVTGSCESVANIFLVKDDKKFLPLAQTAQLFLEELIIKNNIIRSFTSNRSFRKDNKDYVGNDGRHLNDFELLEVEVLDMDLYGLISLSSEFLIYVFDSVLTSNYKYLPKESVKMLEKDISQGFKVVRYKDCIDILKDEGERVEFGDDLTSHYEQKLVNYFNSNLMITHYPEKIKFFNMKITRDENFNTEIQTVDCVDVILRFSGETIGGSEREYDYNILRDRLFNGTMIKQLKMLKEEFDGKPDEIDKEFEGYLNLFKDGIHKRSGFGLGFGRLAQYILSSPTIIDF